MSTTAGQGSLNEVLTASLFALTPQLAPGTSTGETLAAHLGEVVSPTAGTEELQVVSRTYAIGAIATGGEQ